MQIKSTIVKWKSLSCVRLFAPPWTIHSFLGVLQARIVEWVAYPFSRGSSWPRSQMAAMQADSLPTELSGKPTISYFYSTYPLEFLGKKKMTTPMLPRIKTNSILFTYSWWNVRWYGHSGKERVPLKTKHTASIQSSYCTPGHLSQRNEDLCLHRKLYKNSFTALFIIAKN